MEIEYSPRFLKRYKKLPEEIKKLAEYKESIFRTNPYHPSLNTHKLSGVLNGFWSFSVNYRYRVLFEYISENRVKFYTIGGHEVYEQ